MPIKRTIAFLLGSGISVPAGFPSIRQIMEQLLSGEGLIMRNQHFYFGTQGYPFQNIAFRHIQRIIFLLKKVIEIIERQHGRSENEPVNYEEIAYVISQCYSHILGEYDNPVVEEFLKTIVDSLKLQFFVDYHDPADIEKRRQEFTEEVINRSELQSFFEEAENYIKDVVAAMLNRIIYAPTEHLAFIVEAINDEDNTEINLITLNNDLLLEQALFKQSIAYADGFSVVNGKKYFDPKTYRNDVHVNVIKPHGSTNWYYNRDTYQVAHSSPLEAMPYERPYMLIGTNNKLLEYSRAPYTALFAEFYLRLQRSDALIICGYGFGDKGVNSQIIDWMYDDKAHRIVVIHRDGESITGSSMSGAIRRNFQIWVKEGRVAFVEKFLSLEKPLTWDEIKPVL